MTICDLRKHKFVKEIYIGIIREKRRKIVRLRQNFKRFEKTTDYSDSLL